MKSSPDLRRWSAWRSQANAKARSIVSRSIAGSPLAVCSPMTANRSPSSARSSGGQALGDLVHRGRGPVRVVGADLDVAASPRAAAPLPAASSVFARSGIADPPRSASDRRRTPRSAQDPSPTRIRPPGVRFGTRTVPCHEPELDQDPRPAGGRLGRARVGTLAAAEHAPALPRRRRRPLPARDQRAVERRERGSRRPLVGVHAQRELGLGATVDAVQLAGSGAARAHRGGRTAADRSPRGGRSARRAPGRGRAPPSRRAPRRLPATATRASAAATSASARRAETRPSSPPPKRAGRAALSTSSRRRIASAHSGQHRPPLDASAAIVAVADAPRRSTRSRVPAGRANCGGQGPSAALSSASWRRQNSSAPIAPPDGSPFAPARRVGRARRVDRAEHDARLDRAVPLVELELDREVERARRRLLRRASR